MSACFKNTGKPCLDRPLCEQNGCVRKGEEPLSKFPKSNPAKTTISVCSHGNDPRACPECHKNGYSEYDRAPGHIQWNPEGTTPPPDPVTEYIRQKMLQRQRIGWTKYGVGLGRDDFTMDNWLQHLEEELMDAIQYVVRLRMTLNGSLKVQGPSDDIKVEQELPAQEIARLTRDIGDKQARILQLVGVDPRIRYTSMATEEERLKCAHPLRESQPELKPSEASEPEK